MRPEPSKQNLETGGESFFRSERIVYINNYWYFQSRERAPEGPFRTRAEAEQAVDRYVQLVTSPMFSDTELERINSLNHHS